MEDYRSVNELIKLGINKNTLNSGLRNNRAGISDHYQHKKDIADKRKVLILLSSIPKETLEKSNIVIHQETPEEKSNTLALQNAAENSNQYLNGYLPLFKNDLEKAKPFAVLQSVLICMVGLTGGGEKASRNSLKTVWTAYNKICGQYGLKQFKQKPHLSRLLKKFRLAYLAGDDVELIVLGGRFGNCNAKKTNDFHIALLIIYASNPRKLAMRVVADMINHHAVEYGFDKITREWVQMMLRNDPELKTIILRYRHGKEYFSNKYVNHLPRQLSPYSGDVWMMDGSALPFFILHEGKKIRPWLFIVFDVCTRKIIGYKYGFSENTDMVLSALRMAIDLTGHLPRELVYDNHSVNKKAEFKEFIDYISKAGTNYRTTSNAGDKGNVERVQGTIDKVVFSMSIHYVGGNITAKDINSIRDRGEVRMRVMQNGGLPSSFQMEREIVSLIGVYNETSLSGRLSPNKAFSTFDTPNVIKVAKEQRAVMFWESKGISVRKSMVMFQVEKVFFQYEIYDHKLKMKLRDKRVRLRYDKTDMSVIMMFDVETDLFISELKQITPIANGIAARTERDDEKIVKHASRIKSYDRLIENEYEERIDKGLAVVGSSQIDFNPEDPLKYNKERANTEENEVAAEYYFGQNFIPEYTDDIPTASLKKEISIDDSFAFQTKKIKTSPSRQSE